MSKTVTLRLSEEEYQQILASANTEHRPISNFITYTVLQNIHNSLYTNPIETAQINSDKKLLKRLKTGHNQVKGKKGKFVE